MTVKQLYNKNWYLRNKEITIQRANTWSKENPQERKAIRNKIQKE